MASKIEWTEATWNPIVGCSLASPGCTNCYAMTMAARLERMGQARYAGLTKQSKAGAVWTGEVRFVPEALSLPLKRRKPTIYFVNSMSDLFHEDVPDAWIDTVFAVMALCPQHTFQVLTKRAARMRAYVTTPGRKRTIAATVMHVSMMAMREAGSHEGGIPLDHFSACFRGDGPFPNVWLGVSAEDQARADARRSDLAALAYGGWITFVSYEPALGPIDWRGWQFLYWMISGGESGHRARIHSPFWHRATRDFAGAHGIPYLFKQWGCYAPLPAALPVTGPSELHNVAWPDGTVGPGCPTRNGGPGIQLYATTKAYAGRLLDGRLHDTMPEVAHA